MIEIRVSSARPEALPAALDTIGGLFAVGTRRGPFPNRYGNGQRYYLTAQTSPAGRVIGAILAEVGAERRRQLAKWGVQHRADGTSIALTHAATVARERCQQAEAAGGADWARVLSEEVSEAFCETDPARLRAELVQVAAVAAAWIEDIDSRTARAPR
jgi:hypothetical protein